MQSFSILDNNRNYPPRAKRRCSASASVQSPLGDFALEDEMSEITEKRCRIFQNHKGQWVSRRNFSYTIDGLPNSAGFDDVYPADCQGLATSESYKWLATKASKPITKVS